MLEFLICSSKQAVNLYFYSVRKFARHLNEVMRGVKRIIVSVSSTVLNLASFVRLQF